GERPNVSWWLVGDGPERRGLEELVNRAGLADRIRFLGIRNDAPYLMKKAYVHVLGSMYEGLPLVVLETAALGVPTVGTRVGGLDEAVVNGSTGLLVPRESSDALADGVKHVLDDPDLRERLGSAARQFVFEHFDSEALIDRLLNLYESDLNVRYSR